LSREVNAVTVFAARAFAFFAFAGDPLVVLFL
jgi:hypothetical protein